MSVIPCGHRLVVKPQKIEDIDPVYAAAKAAGLAIVDGREKRSEQMAVDKGLVVAIGSTAWRDFGEGEPWCKVGDTILYARHAGKLVEDPKTKEEFLVLNDEDVVARFGE